MSDLRARPDLREYLRANLSDGDEGGVFTAPTATFLTELVDVVNEWLAVVEHADGEARLRAARTALHRHAENVRGCTGCALIQEIIDAARAAPSESRDPVGLREALTEWQALATEYSETLLRLGHHQRARHRSPEQYDFDSSLACTVPRCLAALPSADRETAPLNTQSKDDAVTGAVSPEDRAAFKVAELRGMQALLCELCGSPVEVVSSDEGTSHYRPRAARETAEEAPSLPTSEWARLRGVDDLARLLVSGWVSGFPVGDGDGEADLIERLRALTSAPAFEPFALRASEASRTPGDEP